MALDPYLFFDGTCEEAFLFYAKTLGGKMRGMMKYGDSPEGSKAGPELRDKIVHAMLEVGDRLLMASDWGAPEPYLRPQGFYVSLSVKEAAEAERVFAELSQGGQVHMPMQETFWSPRFGMLRDRFGVPWMVNCEQQPTQR